VGHVRAPMQRSYAILAFMIFACGPSNRTGGDDNPASDASGSPDTGDCKDVVDVVFVLDTSSSMGFVLSQLESQIGQVVTASNMPAAHTLAERVTALRDGDVRVFSFSRLTQPNILERGGTGRRLPWADITDGWTTPYKNAMPIPDQTDGGNFDLDMVKSGTLS